MATTSTTDDSNTDEQNHNDIGLYRPFAEMAWNMLLQLQSTDDDLLNMNHHLHLEPVPDLPDHLQHQTAPARGGPSGNNNNVVRMETRALRPIQESKSSPIRYARFALLETIPEKRSDGNDDDDAASSSSSDTDTNITIHTSGIQVLNLVVFPKNRNHPVWGADFVSLPGNKHLLLLDAQPMRPDCTLYKHWNKWHDQLHGIGSSSSSISSSDNDTDSSSSADSDFPWGGDLPPAVQKFVSPRALWTRMGAAAAAGGPPNTVTNKDDNDDDSTSSGSNKNDDPTELIQGKLLDVFRDHLQLYLNLLVELENKESNDDEDDNKNWSREYLQYRLDNDPARPMLKSLYGEEWTEEVLQTVLFPIPRLLEQN